MDKSNTYVQQVQQRLQKLHLEDYVTMTGIIDDVSLRKLYGQADLLLNPSVTNETTFEGFGLVFLEANAYGIPCIGPNTSGATEAIANGKSGYTVDIENPEEIAKRMHQILDEKRIHAETCRSWAEEHSATVMTQKVESLYKTML